MASPNEGMTADAENEELLRSSEELDHSHALLSAIAEGTPNAIYLKTPEGRYLLANSAAARVAGVPAEAMAGKHDFELFPPEIAAHLRQHDQAVLASGEAGVYEETLEAGGRKRIFLSTKSPYRKPDGSIAGIIGISQDITGRKQGEDKLRFLMEASEFLYGPIEGRKTLQLLADLAVPYLADWATVHLTRADGTLEQTAVAHLDPEKKRIAEHLAEHYPPDPAKQNPIFQVMESGRPMMWARIPEELLGIVAEDDEHFRIIDSLGLRSAIVLPLIRPGKVLGTMTFATSESGRSYGEEDLLLAQELARRAALAIENESLYLQLKIVASSFQKSLLPPQLPHLEGIDLAARYLPAGDGMGGDFYDILDVGGPGWLVTIGDVCGKGVEAAATTATIRHTVRAVAMQEKTPSRILAAVNDALSPRMEEFRFFTMACTILAPPAPGVRTRRLTISSGGHPLPLVLRRDRSVATVGREGTLLGVFADPDLADTTLELEPGDSVLLFTDGAFCERAGHASPERILQNTLARCAGLSAEDIAAKMERGIAALKDHSGPADDTAFVILQVV